ncbi:MAG: hypothetical protein KIT84_09980 [Labilithrix sp.]|nr:hypothetical protein [Labilithrix sp.]MCW5811331.1 hypothetical protein [Labilithrix sp.]
MSRATLLVTIAVSALSCSIATADGEVGAVPDQKSFIDGKVSDYMERRCGMLDCHGQEGRPLRLFSEWGLRLEADKNGQRVAKATTQAERVANYRAVVSLEPEELAKCYDTKGEDYTLLQLLKKPLSLENGGMRHKGGPVLTDAEDDNGWKCLFGWASGAVDATACAEASKVQ